MAVLDADVKRRALAATEALARLGRVRAAYVFGSHAEGRPDRWSDIDLAAFMEGVGAWDIRRRARAMTQVQEETGFDIEAHLFADTALRHPQPGSFAAYILKHGVCISGQD